jgi:hypothetical protein
MPQKRGKEPAAATVLEHVHGKIVGWKLALEAWPA